MLVPKLAQTPKVLIFVQPTVVTPLAAADFAQVMFRVQVNPPLPPFIHCSYEPRHGVQPDANSAAVESWHVAVELARPTDWYQI